MPTINDNIHYVKFIRGSIQAWNNLLTTPDKIDDDTLYFIYSSAQNTKEGKLYLGQKLISGVGEGNIVNINDIGDVFIDNESIQDKQLLVYNETNEQWENASLSDIIDTAIGVMQGATSQTAGISGLVPAPQAGDEDKFLKGNGTWTPIAVPTFNNDIFEVNNNEVTLNGFGLAAVGSIPIKTSNGIEWTSAPVDTLNRQITTLEKLQAQLAGTDPEPIDYNTIYMVLNGNNTESSNKYDEYMVIGDNLELLGTFGEVNLNNYVTQQVFNSTIQSLEDILQDTTDEDTGETNYGLVSRVTNIENNYVTQAQIGDLNTLLLSDGNTTLVQEVNTISERLKWHDLV